MNSASNNPESTCARFLQDLDKYVADQFPSGEMLDLYQLGGNAMLMNYGLNRPTKDFDVLNYQSPILEKIETVFGKTSAYARTHSFYLELVPTALPAVPEGFRQRCTLMQGDWKCIKVWIPEIHDLIVTKLKRFSVQDRSDIRYLCDQFPEKILVETLRERVDSAFAWYYKDDEYQESTRRHLERIIQYRQGERDDV